MVKSMQNSEYDRESLSENFSVLSKEYKAILSDN